MLVRAAFLAAFFTFLAVFSPATAFFAFLAAFLPPALPPPAILSHCASFSTFVPCLSAAFNFDPALGPATSRSVSAFTVLPTVAPSAFAFACASALVMLSSSPVKTIRFPATPAM